MYFNVYELAPFTAIASIPLYGTNQNNTTSANIPLLGIKHLCFLQTTSHEIGNIRDGENLRHQRDSKSLCVHDCSHGLLGHAVMQVMDVFKHQYGVSNEAGLFSLPC